MIIVSMEPLTEAKTASEPITIQPEEDGPDYYAETQLRSPSTGFDFETVESLYY